MKCGVISMRMQILDIGKLVACWLKPYSESYALVSTRKYFEKIIETQCFSEVLKAFDVPMKTLFFFCFKWESFFHLGFGIKFQWIRFSYSLQNVKDTAFFYLTVIVIFRSCCPLRIGFCLAIYVNILLVLLVASFLWRINFYYKWRNMIWNLSSVLS